MHPLDFALRLRMPVAAEAQLDTLLHQPHAQPRPARSLHVPPRYAVVHQHPIRHPDGLEDLLQRLPHRLARRLLLRPQPQQIAAVIVEDRQRQQAPRLEHLGHAFEVHLPQLVRLLPLEPLCRRPHAVLRAHQPMPQQDAVNRDHRQLDAFARQHHLQLARAPIGPLAALLDHALLELVRRPPRARARSAAALDDPGHSVLPVAAQPLVPGLPADVELAAQRRHRLLAAFGQHGEPYPLFLHLHLVPCHPPSFSSCQRCPDNDVSTIS
jgi:hypothetical protein